MSVVRLMRGVVIVGLVLSMGLAVTPSAHADPTCMPGFDLDSTLRIGEPFTWFEEGTGHNVFVPTGTAGSNEWSGIRWWSGTCGF